MLNSLLKKYHLSTEILVILFLRIWQALAGLATTLLAVHFLSAEEQGWYYSFISVAALYYLFDLGLSSVLVQVSAHAYTKMNHGTTATAKQESRRYYEALIGRATRWYALLALLFIIALLPGGFIFFASKHSANIHWISQWMTLCLLTAGGLLVMPLMSIMEGSGQIAQVYSVRLTQAVAGSLLCWLTLYFIPGLWATVMVPAMGVLVPTLWVCRARKEILLTAKKHIFAKFDWYGEVWPLQWRIGINWLCGYLLTQINIPILFQMQGATVAGQLGLSLAIVNTLALISQTWLTRRVPHMAGSVARKDWAALDKTFAISFGLSILLFSASGTCALFLHWWLGNTKFVHRLLPFWPFAGLLAFTLANQIISGFATHLRSYRREPLMRLILISTLVAVPAILWAVKLYSVAGMVAVLDVIYILINLPIAFILWRKYNRVWRQEA